MATQIGSQIAKTLVTPSNSFFPGGGEDIGRILSKPETVTNIYSKETIAVEEEIMDLVETRSIKFCSGETEGKGGGCF
jgi:hypothetical protein